MHGANIQTQDLLPSATATTSAEAPIETAGETQAAKLAETPAATAAAAPLASPSPIVITKCGPLSQAGNYILTGDFNCSSGLYDSFFYINGTGIHLDCAGHAILMNNPDVIPIYIMGSNITITNCDIRTRNYYSIDIINGSDVHVANSTMANVLVANLHDSSFSRNTINGTYSQRQSYGVTLDGNVIKQIPGSQVSVVYSLGGYNNTFSNNVMDGAWDQDPATIGKVGAAQGILLTNESNDTVQSNSIKNIGGPGLLTIGSLTNTLINGNSITDTAEGIVAGGIANWSNNIISNNTVQNANAFFRATYDPKMNAPLIFEGNQILGNTFSKGVAQAVTSPISIDFQNSVPSQLTITAGNNLIQGNNFGRTSPPLVLLPPEAFTDGGGNICSSSVSAAIACLRPQGRPPPVPGRRRIWPPDPPRRIPGPKLNPSQAAF